MVVRPLDFRPGPMTAKQSKDRCVRATSNEVANLLASRDFEQWLDGKRQSTARAWRITCVFALLLAAASATSFSFYGQMHGMQDQLLNVEVDAGKLLQPSCVPPTPNSKVTANGNGRLQEVHGDGKNDESKQRHSQTSQCMLMAMTLLQGKGLDEAMFEGCIHAFRGPALWSTCIMAVIGLSALARHWRLLRQLKDTKEELVVEKKKAQEAAKLIEAAHLEKKRAARLDQLKEERAVLEPQAEGLEAAEKEHEQLVIAANRVAELEDRMRRLPALKKQEESLTKQCREVDEQAAKVAGKVAILDAVTDHYNTAKRDADSVDQLLLELGNKHEEIAKKVKRVMEVQGQVSKLEEEASKLAKTDGELKEKMARLSAMREDIENLKAAVEELPTLGDATASKKGNLGMPQAAVKAMDTTRMSPGPDEVPPGSATEAPGLAPLGPASPQQHSISTDAQSERLVATPGDKHLPMETNAHKPEKSMLPKPPSAPTAHNRQRGSSPQESTAGSVDGAPDDSDKASEASSIRNQDLLASLDAFGSRMVGANLVDAPVIDSSEGQPGKAGARAKGKAAPVGGPAEKQRKKANDKGNFLGNVFRWGGK
ncbi:unnamed protein product [Ostreobium quekettii]|uniref:Uncharacterized protein n=1 Tax=Ostreobium quekettii TaxID=121088 RepID=A0A8S1J8F0_9CHLO|nr:unnamed protein product [Ostreobium quekettii]|eukprot:evm.model.scf_258.3 EVM.evm.TU.scf_258.3   scf_258:50996-56886(+)